MMQGWKTWLAAIGLVAMGIMLLVQKQWFGVVMIVAAIAVVGLGHKLDKIKEALIGKFGHF